VSAIASSKAKEKISLLPKIEKSQKWKENFDGVSIWEENLATFLSFFLFFL